MKKIIALFLICVCCVFFTSCGTGETLLENTSSKNLLNTKKSLSQDISCQTILRAIEQEVAVPKYEKMYLKERENFDAYSMSLWCDGTYKSFEQAHLIEDYAVYLGGGISTFEIAILKFADSVDDKTKEDIFARRKNALASGDKGAYDPNFESTMENAVVYIDGNFGILLITEHNDTALEVIEELKK